jgi:hypothetical protein
MAMRWLQRCLALLGAAALGLTVTVAAAADTGRSISDTLSAAAFAVVAGAMLVGLSRRREVAAI